MSALEVSPVETHTVDPSQGNIFDVLQDTVTADGVDTLENVGEEPAPVVEEDDEEDEQKKELEKSIADLSKIFKIFFVPFVAGLIGKRFSGILYRYFFK